ncbi:hypothetical protein [Desulfotignum balticum]|uniref:hypothetical protein n=1 Tax=Desulfotignum balticum TaxID=115781 RepID=UPI0004624E7B|nr:hypothetical protein [Desulfotignum balticum]
MDDILLDWYASQQNSRLLYGLNELIQFNYPSFFIRQIKQKMLRKIKSYAMLDVHEIDNDLCLCCDFFIKEISNTKNIDPVQKIVGINAINKAMYATFFADHHSSSSTKNFLFDEGLGMRTLTLGRFVISQETILKYFEHIPQPDAYVTMILNDEKRYQRMIMRKDDKILRSFFHANNEKTKRAFNVVQDVIKKNNIPNLYIDAQDTLEKNARIVTSFVQSLNQ